MAPNRQHELEHTDQEYICPDWQISIMMQRESMICPSDVCTGTPLAAAAPLSHSPGREHPPFQLGHPPPESRHLVAKMDHFLRPPSDQLVVPPPRQQHALPGPCHPLLVPPLYCRVVGTLPLRVYTKRKGMRGQMSIGRTSTLQQYDNGLTGRLKTSFGLNILVSVGAVSQGVDPRFSTSIS